jgi:hypothetical protein
VVAAANFELDDEAWTPREHRAGSLAAIAPPDFPASHGQAAAEGDSGALAEVADPTERAQAYVGRSKSEATIRAYAAGWRDFLAFCEQHAASPLPSSEQTVAAYLAHLADRGAKAATIAGRLVVISQAHKAADLPSRPALPW